MGKVIRSEVVRVLREFNKKAKSQDVEIYADAFVAYAEARANIAQHGSIVMHPKTGAPIENPYSKVASSAVVVMRGCRLRSDAAWAMLDD